MSKRACARVGGGSLARACTHLVKVGRELAVLAQHLRFEPGDLLRHVLSGGVWADASVVVAPELPIPAWGTGAGVGVLLASKNTNLNPLTLRSIHPARTTALLVSPHPVTRYLAPHTRSRLIVLELLQLNIASGLVTSTPDLTPFKLWHPTRPRMTRQS